MNNTVYDFKVKSIDGKEVNLSDYKDKVLLIVNTASKCGFTPQFEGLEKLFEVHSKEGFSVLGFPCNQFANQEPEDEKGIKSFCTLNYGVTFPMFAKIEVNGSNAAPLYEYLKGHAHGFLSKKIKWNFTKFLVGRDGKVIRRFSPSTKPETIEKYIVDILNKN